jgi:SAM-dependent methyltransferase
VSSIWPELLDQIQARYPSRLAFAIDWWQYNAPFLARVKKTLPSGGSILEVGTGTGALAVLLAAHGYHVTAVDLDRTAIEHASAFAEYFRVSCAFEVADGFDLSRFAGRFDLAFSGGVLEHFERAQAVRMLREKARAAPKVLAITPTWHALKNDPATGPTDARPMTLRKLRGLFSDAGLTVTRQFGYGMPDGMVGTIFRLGVPRAAQLLLQNRLSYACTVGCIGERAE